MRTVSRGRKTSEVYLCTRHSEDSFQKFASVSLILHGAALIAAIFSGIWFPSSDVPLIPTLRVDLVALPDQLKSEKLSPDLSESIQALKAAEEKAKNVAKPDLSSLLEKAKPIDSPPDPDEMVAKTKTKKDKKLPKKEQERQDRIQNALDRIKALNKIQGLAGAQQPVFKGNQLSPGLSVSGEARENMEMHYYELIRARLQENWELPVWLARRNLSARVQLWIDARGRLTKSVFTQSSGNAQFDDAVLKTIQASQPFPQPPAGTDSSLMRGIPVHFPL